MKTAHAFRTIHIFPLSFAWQLESIVALKLNTFRHIQHFWPGILCSVLFRCRWVGLMTFHRHGVYIDFIHICKFVKQTNLWLLCKQCKLHMPSMPSWTKWNLSLKCLQSTLFFGRGKSAGSSTNDWLLIIWFLFAVSCIFMAIFCANWLRQPISELANSATWTNISYTRMYFPIDATGHETNSERNL